MKMTLQRKKYKLDLILFKESEKLSCQLESLKLRLLEESEARQVIIVWIYGHICIIINII
jgi:isochorismate hydrolase